MPIKLGSSLLIGSMLGAVEDMLVQLPALGYEDKVVFHVLLGLGLDAKEAQHLSSLAIELQTAIPMNGIIAKILALPSPVSP